MGLSNSVNNISAWVMKQFTPQAVVDMIKQLGIHSKVEPFIPYSLELSNLVYTKWLVLTERCQ
jgi:membrane peptidoglycan carboxypeptidase